MKHKVKRQYIYILLKAMRFFVSILPREVGLFLGRMLGWLLYHFSGNLRQIAINNLELAFAEEKTPQQIRNLAKKIFINQGMGLIDFAYLSRLNKNNVDRIIECTPQTHDKIKKVFSRNKGIIAISAHLGSWELLAAYFALKGYPVSVIARKIRYEKYDNLIKKYRTSKGVEVLDRDDAFRRALRRLKENWSVAVLPDQDVDSIDGVFVDFFGQPTYTPTGPVALAMVSEAPLLPCFIIRNAKHHKVFVEDPVELEITGDRKKDFQVNTQKWSRITESYIRKYPEQWVWMHRRWKTKKENVQ